MVEVLQYIEGATRHLWQRGWSIVDLEPWITNGYTVMGDIMVDAMVYIYTYIYTYIVMSISMWQIILGKSDWEVDADTGM